MSESSLPPVAALLTHRVADFDAWKAVFDAHEPARRDAGILGHHINRSREDPNLLTVYLAVQDRARAEAFAASQETKDEMSRAGVAAPPVITWMHPLREAVVWDRELPAFVISHRVEDIDRWLAGYDQAGPLQQQGRILGHAANQQLDDPTMVSVYHQAASFGDLEAFLDLPELKEAMQEAGVVSEPEVTFHTGGWAEQYS